MKRNKHFLIFNKDVEKTRMDYLDIMNLAHSISYRNIETSDERVVIAVQTLVKQGQIHNEDVLLAKDDKIIPIKTSGIWSNNETFVTLADGHKWQYGEPVFKFLDNKIVRIIPKSTCLLRRNLNPCIGLVTLKGDGFSIENMFSSFENCINQSVPSVIKEKQGRVSMLKAQQLTILRHLQNIELVINAELEDINHLTQLLTKKQDVI